jgi:hypothetical protein
MFRVKSIIILLILIFNFGLIEAWSNPVQKQITAYNETNKLSPKKTTEHQKPSEQFVTQQQLDDAITHAIDASNEKYKATQNPLPPDNSSWWFSFYMLIFTGAMVLVGAGQCYIIFKTLKETERAAKAAEKAAIVAENAMIHSQRPYIFVNKIIHNIKPDEAIGELIIVLENTGETPTKKMICNFDYCTFLEELPDNFNFPEKGQRQYGTIGRKATLDVKVLMPFNVFKDTLTKKHRLYIYGWIDYNDVFPNTIRHRTESCYEVIINQEREFFYHIHGDYNGFDDECSRNPSPYTTPT